VYSKVPNSYFGSNSGFARKTFLRKHLGKSRCYNCKICSMPLESILHCSWARSHRGRHYDCFFIFTHLLIYTDTRLTEAE